MNGALQAQRHFELDIALEDEIATIITLIIEECLAGGVRECAAASRTRPCFDPAAQQDDRHGI